MISGEWWGDTWDDDNLTPYADFLAFMQGLAKTDITPNVAADRQPTENQMPERSESEAEIIAHAEDLQRMRKLAIRRLINAVHFFKEMEAVMAVSTKQVFDALDALAEHFKNDDAVKDQLITLIKAKPTEAEMQQILDRTAAIQSGVDQQTADEQAALDAANGTAPAGGDVPVGDGTTGTTGATGTTGTTGDASADVKNPNQFSRPS